MTTSNRHLAFSILRAAAGILLILNTTAAPQAPEPTTDRHHAFARRLEGLYVDYLESARRGDVPNVLRMLAAESAREASGMSSELLRGMSADELDPRQSAFVKIDVSMSTLVSRMVYEQLGPQNAAWQAVIFQNENGDWKIVKIVKQARSGSETGDGLQTLLAETDSFLRER